MSTTELTRADSTSPANSGGRHASPARMAKGTILAEDAGPSPTAAKSEAPLSARLPPSFRQRLAGPLRLPTPTESDLFSSQASSPLSPCSTSPKLPRTGSEVPTPTRRQRIAAALHLPSYAEGEAGGSAGTSPLTSIPPSPIFPRSDSSSPTSPRRQRIAALLHLSTAPGAEEGAELPRTSSRGGRHWSPDRVLSPRNARAPAAHLFPEMEGVMEEEVVRRAYDGRTKTWRETTAKAQVHPEPFTSGNTCAYHFMLLLRGGGPPKRCVARRLLSKEDGARRFDLDARTAFLCQQIAAAYNATSPVKPAQFLDSFAIQRPDGQWWGVEGYLPGEHGLCGGNRHGLKEVGDQKHDQAFSHFSCHYTKRRLLVTELRGTAQCFRRPTVYTHDGAGFGAANQGAQGIEEFFHCHWCSSACSHAGLETHFPGRMEKRMGDMYRGAGVASHDTFAASAFVGELRPVVGGAPPEDLTLLGLTAEQFAQLVGEFTALDGDGSGDLNHTEVQAVYLKANTMTNNTLEGAACKAFAEAVRRRFAPAGVLTFQHFVLCWSKNN